jgi:hypothetical protein
MKALRLLDRFYTTLILPDALGKEETHLVGGEMMGLETERRTE